MTCIDVTTAERLSRLWQQPSPPAWECHALIVEYVALTPQQQDIVAEFAAKRVDRVLEGAPESDQRVFMLTGPWREEMSDDDLRDCLRLAGGLEVDDAWPRSVLIELIEDMCQRMACGSDDPLDAA